jgi:hypothetical protein
MKNPQKPHKKSEPSFHEKQIRFLTLFFGVIVVSIFIAILWLANASRWPGR